MVEFIVNIYYSKSEETQVSYTYLPSKEILFSIELLIVYKNNLVLNIYL